MIGDTEPTFVPVEKWPQGITVNRRRASFHASFDRTLRDLKKELSKLEAEDIVIQLYLERGQIRNDGWPRAGVNPTEPGVILTFKGKQGPISMPCDTFDHWHGNLRAIVLTLQNLRAINRYGVTSRGEQYRGWLSLPAPGYVEPVLSTVQAAEFLSKNSTGYSAEEILQTFHFAEVSFQQARGKLHPDKPTGNHDKYLLLQDAFRIMKVHHGR